MSAEKPSGHVQGLLERTREWLKSFTDVGAGSAEGSADGQGVKIDANLLPEKKLDTGKSQRLSARRIGSNTFFGGNLRIVAHAYRAQNAEDGHGANSDSDFFTLEMPSVSSTVPQDVHLWLRDLIGVYEFFSSAAGEGLVEWAKSLHLSAPPVANAPIEIIDSEPIERVNRGYSFTDVFPPSQSVTNECSAATALPLEEQLSGFDYDSLIEYAAKHWDSIERLSAVLVAFRRNLPQWSAMMPVGWRGRDDIERIEQRICHLVQASRAPSPVVDAPPSEPESPIGQGSQAPGVPEWPYEAKAPQSVALAGNHFSYSRGVLSYMGYHVGKAATLTSERRHRILDYVLLGALPQVNDPQYMRTWGRPKTAARLRKLANAVATFARNARRKRKKNMGQAIAEWEADLAYLKKRYYDRRRRDWKWPATVRPGRW